ncbi:sterol carrier protein 2 [Perkinsus chesapeaki]|uniref:propanoyl-CoA C-acyltransferase n=1 Tax=Perkinsus chesapeaki TaxID=330153 RepID=A0A7J6M9M6_PERCH|nr:sterol carrier protein 2 [Perkinsus chesapeaki]
MPSNNIPPAAVSMLEQLQKAALMARGQAEDVGDDIRVGNGRPATPKATFDRIKVGMRCQLEPFDRRGEIAYIQPNHCGLGTWVGIRLDEPCEDARQDGTFLDGVRYFETEPGYAMWTRPEAVTCGPEFTPYDPFADLSSSSDEEKDIDYVDLGALAIQRAVRDAGIPAEAIQAAYAGYVYGDSTCGQRVIYQAIGCSGIPIFNVNNNCSTGASAMYLGRQAIMAGMVDVCLVVGFEKMERGSLGAKYTDRTNPLDRHMTEMASLRGLAPAPGPPQLFGNAGIEHMEKYGTTQRQLACIASKNHNHSANNPYSQFRDRYTVDEVLASPKVFGPLTKLQCCPTSDGAAACILMSEKAAREYGLLDQSIEMLSMVLVTDTAATFTTKSCMDIVGYDMTKKAIAQVLGQTGLKPNDFQVVELHDCFSANELITTEALGLCGEGQAGPLNEQGRFTYGNNSICVINPSGGLISKGHPLGATGLAQCCELTWQLRGSADKRQVNGVKHALQHNLGLGGACVVAAYKKTNTAPAARALPSDPAILEAWESAGYVIQLARSGNRRY